MPGRLEGVLEFVQRALIEPLGRLGAALAGAVRAFFAAACGLRRRLVMAVLLTVFAYGLYVHPPFATARRGDVLVRANVFNGSVSAYTVGTVLVRPGIHQVRSDHAAAAQARDASDEIAIHLYRARRGYVFSVAVGTIY